MLKEGNLFEANSFRVSNTPKGFGVRKKLGLFEIKLRFKEDIADFINKQLFAPSLKITNTCNKGTRTIYGHATPFEADQFMRLKMRGKGNRLISQGLKLCKQSSGEIC